MITAMQRIELERTPWSTLRSSDGTAEMVPTLIVRLMEARTRDAASEALMDLERAVVVGGQLFEVAPYVVSVLIAGLEDGLAKTARSSALEMIFLCVTGGSHREEVALGAADLGPDCIARARAGLWTLYRQFGEGLDDSVCEVLEIVEDDDDRLLAFIEKHPQAVEIPTREQLQALQQRRKG